MELHVRDPHVPPADCGYRPVMLPAPDDCFRAWRTRDTRFDGRLFMGVRTTGIYCRPVCPSRLPRREHCEFFGSAAAAEAAGFRPCLRCRPEIAPGLSAVDASARLARAAAAAIEDNLDAPPDSLALAGRLGVTDRHLRRVFHAAFGVTPSAYALTQRLLHAKRLLTETALPVVDVAYAAGFGSVRAFQSQFTRRYGLAPSVFRRAAPPAGPDTAGFRLAYRPPFDWPAISAFLDRRSIDGVEHLGDGAYHRTARVVRGETVHTGWIRVTPDGGAHALRVTVSDTLLPAAPAVLRRVRRLFDLEADPAEIAARLGALAAGSPGLRLPGAFDPFEMAVRAILGQQITVKAARTLAGRFAQAFGMPLDAPDAALRTLFPSAATVADASIDAIASLGIVSARAQAIRALARAVCDGSLTLEPTADVPAQLDRLRALPGIGEWTAQYLAMRALGWPDAFPHTDYGVRKALGTTSDREVLARAEGWRPWRAYAVMHLWRSLSETS